MMLVSFAIPGPLREFSGNQTSVRIEVLSGANLLEGLQALFTAYPGLRDRILTESGQLRQHVNVFIGKEDIRYTGGLTTPLPANAEITIVPAISGG